MPQMRMLSCFLLNRIRLSRMLLCPRLINGVSKRSVKLSNTAEQVIIFIKDTDGELAEEYMGDKIGCRHHFDKKNEFETVLV